MTDSDRKFILIIVGLLTVGLLTLALVRPVLEDVGSGVSGVNSSLREK